MDSYFLNICFIKILISRHSNNKNYIFQNGQQKYKHMLTKDILNYLEDQIYVIIFILKLEKRR